MKKTAEQIENEINEAGFEPMACPVCGFVNVDWGLLQCDQPPYRDNNCRDCESSWTEVYQWGFVRNIVIGDNYENN